MEAKRILFFVDTDSMLATSIDAAQALRFQMGAEITMLVYSENLADQRLVDFDVYDINKALNFVRPIENTSFKPMSLSSRLRLCANSSASSRLTGNRLAAGKTAAIGSAAFAFRVLRLFQGAIGTNYAAKALARDFFARSAIRGVRRILDTVQPDALVVLEDNIQTPSRLLVEEGRRRGMPTIILPFTIPNSKEPAQFYSSDPSYSINNAFKRAFVALRPTWRYDHEGQAMLRLPIDQAITYELRGFATAKPWLLNFGSASAIALESEAMRRAYCKLGFPERMLKVVGEPVGKLLYRSLRERDALRKELCEAHNFDPERLLIVCGFPPNQFSSKATSRFEFNSFEVLLDAWMTTFSDLYPRANVVIRPHPRLDPKLLRYPTSPNIGVSNWNTAELIPLGDIYVASISATIRWAIASGVPVVNYDCYRYRYGDYASVDGVITVESQSELVTTLNRMVDDENHLGLLRARQQAVMGDWGIADDQFAPRFTRLIQELLKDKSKQPAT